MFTYSAYGLVIHSELPLPEATPLAEAEGDAVIRFGKVDWPVSGSSPGESSFHFDQEGAYLYWEGLGKFLVRGGKEIIIDPFASAEEHLIRLPLLGIVLAVLLHQRGLMVLHASAVAIEGRAIAFLGNKGDGKSTTAAMLYGRGHSLLSDDAVVLDFSDPQSPKVIPGFPQFKLWPEAASTLGEDPDLLPKLLPQLEKRLRPVTERFSISPAPLKCICALSWASSLALERLRPQDAILQLIAHTYVSRFGKKLLRAESANLHFSQCVKLARAAPIYRLKRPASLAALPLTAELLESHIKARGCEADVMAELSLAR